MSFNFSPNISGKITLYFDYSIHLYVLNSHRERPRVSDIDTEDYNELMDYQLISSQPELECSQPLYISYQISMISPIVKESQTTFSYLTQTYDSMVWILFFALIIFLSLLTKNLFKKQTFWSSIWSYICLFFGKPNSKRSLSIIQLFYVISIIPFIEIIRNNLLSSLVFHYQKEMLIISMT